MKVKLIGTLPWLMIVLALAANETNGIERRRSPRVVVRPGPILHQPPHSPPRISTRIIGGVNAQYGTVAALNSPAPDSLGVRAAPIIRAGSRVSKRRCLIYNEFNLCVRYV
ncbi:uncharacterized protein LOC125029050 [Penaeus chinensis]|uniref:uncharacterized protein LOC125029050 n=1 Tax=Penaeus chinensis TaxID=139456 RepID=UPI001FB71D7C|nr:uncharacterized protein LOC125029050 [Penaeus chinensis]XP_047474745.1 uncharacterized protein LOC125029050 [Penaeus chinensis]XP_047474746.1 uncharacterized protein LOC125029050 [Penaeus chinensis]XP_047474747.1 uncharacterized protein LOC125029050 [Penaeus chinensis]XP_047474748.1 uncharacterized protein LOC125029050 [Penaeus chinensis]